MLYFKLFTYQTASDMNLSSHTFPDPSLKTETEAGEIKSKAIVISVLGFRYAHQRYVVFVMMKVSDTLF